MTLRTLQNRVYGGIILGRRIRGSINKERIFRIRPGNGFYDTVLGDEYQDQYTYFFPASINNPESEPYRQQWKASVAKWKYGLTDSEKEAYNKRASKGLHMSGYNLFMREAMKGLVQMFVDRGDPAAVDFLIGDLTKDGTWRVLGLSNIIPAAAKGVLIKTRLQSAGVGDRIRYRRCGNTNEINTCSCEALRANALRRRMGVIAVDGNQQIEYNADNVAWAELQIIIRGWWT